MQSNGTVVTSHGFSPDLAVTEPRQQSGRQHEIIQPPSYVLPPGVHHVGPESVGVLLLRVQLAETVDETGLQQLSEALPLFWCEAGVLLVPFGVLEVDLLVSDVEVAAENQTFLFVEVAQVRSEVLVPGFAVVETHQAFAGVGDVGRDQEVTGELGGDDTAFFVVLFFAWRKK